MQAESFTWNYKMHLQKGAHQWITVANFIILYVRRVDKMALAILYQAVKNTKTMSF